MTGGLEAKLTVAVGACVMLRHNIDKKAGLVNSAIATVHVITRTTVNVHFYHISEPYDVENVRT